MRWSRVVVVISFLWTYQVAADPWSDEDYAVAYSEHCRECSEVEGGYVQFSEKGNEESVEVKYRGSPLQ